MKKFRRAIAGIFWRLTPWSLKREVANISGPRIMLGAPHTSNFDFLLMLGIAWDAQMNIHWLGKKELFKGPAGPVMRALGGIPVDRANASGVVAEITKRAKEEPNFTLVVTPEGTRSGKGWRSGFYRIAWEAGLPVTLGFADGSTKSAGLGPTIELTGDVVADMDRIREFYKPITGVRPELRTEPRFHDEPGLSAALKKED